MELGEVRKEVDRVEGSEREEAAKVRDAKVDGRQKRYTLQTIKRLRRQLDNLESRMAIYDRNITLHLNLISKIQDMQAMALRGVTEEKIDEIITEFEQHLAEFSEVVRAGETALEGVTGLAAEENRELEALEREIVAGDKGRSEEKRREDQSLAKIEAEIKAAPASEGGEKRTKVKTEAPAPAPAEPARKKSREAADPEG